MVLKIKCVDGKTVEIPEIVIKYLSLGGINISDNDETIESKYAKDSKYIECIKEFYEKYNKFADKEIKENELINYVKSAVKEKMEIEETDDDDKNKKKIETIEKEILELEKNLDTIRDELRPLRENLTEFCKTLFKDFHVKDDELMFECFDYFGCEKLIECICEYRSEYLRITETDELLKLLDMKEPTEEEWAEIKKNPNYVKYENDI
jgi:dephospho-CoA kinase